MHGRDAECKRILQKINSKVEGYNVKLEYRRMLAEVRSQNVSAAVEGGGSYLDVFRGTNLVDETPCTQLFLKVTLSWLRNFGGTASSGHIFPPVALAGRYRRSDYFYLLELLLRYGWVGKPFQRDRRNKVGCISQPGHFPVHTALMQFQLWIAAYPLLCF